MSGPLQSHFEAPGTRRSANIWSEYEIETKTSVADRVQRTLKFGDSFAVFDRCGDLGTSSDTAEGLFYRDTRFLSYFELRLEGKRPLLLSSSLHENKSALAVELTNPDIQLGPNGTLPRDTIFLHRTKFLYRSVCYERISIKNFGADKHRLRLDFLFDADFHDLFEVRGTKRNKRGNLEPPVTDEESIRFQYLGLDGVKRETGLRFDPLPTVLDCNRATVEVDLPTSKQVSIFVTVSCTAGTASRAMPLNFFYAYREARRARRKATSDIATVTGPNDSFNAVVCRATSDTYTLITTGKLGAYPYAGLPWFNTIFGRDGIITAMFVLWVDPAVARGVLRTLAATQATSIDTASDAEPGKILHEMRHGEMANMREVPFGRYYGTVDATPLFIMLAGLYFQRTGDLQLIHEIWPNICAALNWIDEYGDRDRDGFVEYARSEEGGLANQGWKDSHDAIFHADGRDARGSIALCEVQGYVYSAKQHAAGMARQMGFKERGAALAAEAEQLRKDFEAAFWCERLGTYAIALDGEKQSCEVVASNAGHALFSGIASQERAHRVVRSLMSPDVFSGWGVRTLAATQPRYNPMSYHNGSVWPHDNALIAIGFARYGFKAEASRILAGLFDAATHQDLSRLPELFCGFSRRPHRGPTPYPVACSPQAWAAAAVFGLIGECLGLEFLHDHDELRLRDPFLPEFLDEIEIRNVSLGASRIDIRLHKYNQDVTANVLSRRGSSKIAILK